MEISISLNADANKASQCACEGKGCSECRKCTNCGAELDTGGECTQCCKDENKQFNGENIKDQELEQSKREQEERDERKSDNDIQDKVGSADNIRA